MERRFNLIDEPWLPIVDVGRVSLREVFSNSSYRALGGNPVQKIALMKLLLAIAQAACTPEDEPQWEALGTDGLARHCLAHLERWHDRFFLYGDQPFLQMPAIEKLIAERTRKRLLTAKTPGKIVEIEATGRPKNYGAGFYPDLPSENNTEFSYTMSARELSDADKALFLVSLMNFAFGGKRVESDLVSLGGDALGNRYTAPAGPSLGGWAGQLHCFPLADSVLGSLWVNLLTRSDIQGLNYWSEVGTPLWEKMPASESDDVANAYRSTYLASLLALSRFVLLKDDGLFYLDGIRYPKVSDGWMESSLLVDKTQNPFKVKYVDPERRPWRELEAMLAYNVLGTSKGFECIALKVGVSRLAEKFGFFSIWSGGIKVSSNSGDQSVKQSDDFVESQVWMHSDLLGQTEFAQLQAEMAVLEDLAKVVYGCVAAYYKALKVDGKQTAQEAVHRFWQMCERDVQSLLDHCSNGEEHRAVRQKLRSGFMGYALRIFDQLCPQETARQLEAWAKSRPRLGKYLKEED